MKLSIIIPVFNEEKTISKLIDKVDAVKIPGVTKEIVVGSLTTRTALNLIVCFLSLILLTILTYIFNSSGVYLNTTI